MVEVKGYRKVPDVLLEAVNVNKEMEERALRCLEILGKHPEIDQRMLAIGRTKVQEAYMWINRAIFQPGRVVLPGDQAGSPQ